MSQKQGPKAQPHSPHAKWAVLALHSLNRHLPALVALIPSFCIRSLPPAAFISSPQALESGCCDKPCTQAFPTTVAQGPTSDLLLLFLETGLGFGEGDDQCNFVQ